MNNIIKFTMAAGVLALVGCSETNVSGAAIEGNALAQNSSSSSDVVSSSGVQIPNGKISFDTPPTARVKVTGGDVLVYKQSAGARSQCDVNNKHYSSHVQFSLDSVAHRDISLSGLGDKCEPILEAFLKTCESNVFVLNSSGLFYYDYPNLNDITCENTKDIFIVCDAMHGIETYESCTDGNPSYCTSVVVDTAFFNNFVSDLTKETDDICNSLYADMTLDNYSKQFTENVDELSFDDHVLAFNGGGAIYISAPDSITHIKEISPQEVLESFPKTVQYVGNSLFSENCKLYSVSLGINSYYYGFILNKVSKDSIEITKIAPSGNCTYGKSDFLRKAEFLVQDCDGLIDENAETIIHNYTSSIWKCGEYGYPSGDDSEPHGEWFHPDFVK
jgi:hypothetical protein